MAYSVAIPQKELQRVAGEAYEGKTYRICLASVGSSGYTAESTTANWDSVEKSGSGYARVTGTLATGAYDGTDARYEVPSVTATFTASGGSITFDRVYVVLGTETYISALGTESPAVTLADGQSITYTVQFATDD
jgi:hypothetical protein